MTIPIQFQRQFYPGIIGGGTYNGYNGQNNGVGARIENNLGDLGVAAATALATNMAATGVAGLTDQPTTFRGNGASSTIVPGRDSLAFLPGVGNLVRENANHPGFQPYGAAQDGYYDGRGALAFQPVAFRSQQQIAFNGRNQQQASPALIQLGNAMAAVNNPNLSPNQRQAALNNYIAVANQIGPDQPIRTNGAGFYNPGTGQNTQLPASVTPRQFANAFAPDQQAFDAINQNMASRGNAGRVAGTRAGTIQWDQPGQSQGRTSANADISAGGIPADGIPRTSAVGGSGPEATLVANIARAQLAVQNGNAYEARMAMEAAYSAVRPTARSAGDLYLKPGTVDLQIQGGPSVQVKFDGKPVVGTDSQGTIRGDVSTQVAMQKVADALAAQGVGPRVDVNAILSAPMPQPLAAPAQSAGAGAPSPAVVSQTPLAAPTVGAPTPLTPAAAPARTQAAPLAGLTAEQVKNVQRLVGRAVGDDKIATNTHADGVDGIAGPKTNAALNAVLAKAGLKPSDVDFTKLNSPGMEKLALTAGIMAEERGATTIPTSQRPAPAAAPATPPAATVPAASAAATLPPQQLAAAATTPASAMTPAALPAASIPTTVSPAQAATLASVTATPAAAAAPTAPPAPAAAAPAPLLNNPATPSPTLAPRDPNVPLVVVPIQEPAPVAAPAPQAAAPAAPARAAASNGRNDITLTPGADGTPRITIGGQPATTEQATEALRQQLAAARGAAQPIAYQPPAAASAQPVITPAASPESTLRNQKAALQFIQDALGADLPPGAKMDSPAAQLVIREFQKRNGLEQNGKLDEDTVSKTQGKAIGPDAAVKAEPTAIYASMSGFGGEVAPKASAAPLVISSPVQEAARAAAPTSTPIVYNAGAEFGGQQNVADKRLPEQKGAGTGVA